MSAPGPTRTLPKLPPPAFSSLDDYRRAHDLLRERKFDERGIPEAMGLPDVSAFKEDDAPWMLHLTRGGSPLETLIRLFLIDYPVERQAAEKAFHPLPLDFWANAGLVQVVGEWVEPAVKLIPFRGMYLASDTNRALREGQRSDYVMSVGRSSMMLANLTVRRKVEATLDMGAGCGVLSLLSASHSDVVTAVDRNPRALGFTQFNAALNGLPNVECFPGDLFQPVAGRTFGCIVANPPFVVSPRTKFTFSDGGMEGDELSRRLIRSAPEFLAEGGYCHVLCNWTREEGEDEREKVKRWVSHLGCDAWVMNMETADPATYASTWIRHTERLDDQQYAERFADWQAYYKSKKITAVSGGVVVLRKRTAPNNWLRFEYVNHKMLGPCGEFVERGYLLRDFLEQHPTPDALLDEAYLPSPDLRLLQQCSPHEGRWAIAESRLALMRGFAYAGGCDPLMAHLVASCDGRRPLRDLLTEAAASSKLPVADLTTAALSAVRPMIEQGFLLPASRFPPTPAAQPPTIG